MPYIVGDIELLRKAAYTLYGERTDAEEAARLESYNDQVIAVFEAQDGEEPGEIVSLVLYQVLYRKAD